ETRIAFALEPESSRHTLSPSMRFRCCGLGAQALGAGSAFGEPEHALADDVVLNLVGARRNRAPPRRQHPMRPLAVINGAGGLVCELAIGAQQLHRKRLHAQMQVCSAQVQYVTLRAEAVPM